MKTGTVTFELPSQVYQDLQALAADEKVAPSEIIARLVATARQRRAWLHDLSALREQIHAEGGLQIGTTKDKVIEQLRQSRHDIFEAEYAHLYR